MQKLNLDLLHQLHSLTHSLTQLTTRPPSRGRLRRPRVRRPPARQPPDHRPLLRARPRPLLPALRAGDGPPPGRAGDRGDGARGARRGGGLGGRGAAARGRPRGDREDGSGAGVRCGLPGGDRKGETRRRKRRRRRREQQQQQRHLLLFSSSSSSKARGRGPGRAAFLAVRGRDGRGQEEVGEPEKKWERV